MAAFFTVPSVADLRGITGGRMEHGSFPIYQGVPAELSSSGNGKEEQEGAAAAEPRDHGPATG